MMKILGFANIEPSKPGAYEEFLRRLAERCASAGDRFLVAVAGPPCESVADKWRRAGLEWEIIPRWTDEHAREHPCRFVGPAIRLVQKHDPDVVAIRFGNELPACAAALICRRLVGLRSRWVWEQDQQIADPGVVTRRASRIRLVGMVFDHIIAVYNGGRRSLVLRGIPDDRISVIYNGVKEQVVERPSGWLRKELGVAESEILVGMVSSLISRKRVDVAIKALASGCLEEARLIIAGGGSLEARLIAEAKELGVDGRIHFLGVRPDVSDIMAEMDIFLHTSSAEGCAYVICEAMAVGLPLVVADAGAAREQIMDGESGFVVPVGDVAQTADRLRRLVKDAELRRRIGDAARARWNELFRVEAMAERYHQTYRNVAQFPFDDRRRRVSKITMQPVVIHVVTSLKPGGLERLVVDWTLEREGRHPGSTFVACLDEPGEWAATLGERVVCVRADRARFPWDRKAVASLSAHVGRLAAGGTAVLHAHNLAAWQYAVLAASGPGLPVVYTQHGPNPHCRRWQDRLRYRLLAPRTAAIVAVARAVAEAMTAHQGIHAGRIRLISNGVVCRKPLAGRREWPDDTFVMGFVGRLSAEKGAERLLRTFAVIAKNVCPRPGKKSWGLWFIGDGPARADLEKAAGLLPAAISERIVIAGYRDDVPACLGGMDLFVLPSLAEGCSVALLEAMAAGVPVMATRVGDNEEILDHGRAGVLLDDDDGKWPDQILTFCADHSRAMRMAELAAGRVKEYYSIDRVLSDYEAVYDEAAHDIESVSHSG